MIEMRTAFESSLFIFSYFKKKEVYREFYSYKLEEAKSKKGISLM